MNRLLVLAAAALATAGCHSGPAPSPANDASANITAVNVNAMPDDANITDVPADDGDAPGDTETNAK
jgi:hypothetical protein